MSAIEADDQNLLGSLQRLELDRPKTKGAGQDNKANPFNSFRRRSRSLSSINFGSSCKCSKKSATVKHTTSFKKSTKKILREPVLKFIKCHGDKCAEKPKKLFGQCTKHAEKDFKSLVDACEHLTLGNAQIRKRYSGPCFLNVRTSIGGAKPENGSANMASCSHQARMNSLPPCDVTIDELASYFETSVHIPKKMSTMAEMMYI
ncbi:uncharacterized protein LOC132707130 [Cylas formicarius]|uniref:uncharacterized protein LOC132707130 n=1 Tax=Cylas formicarius TaxID=197179 RepID=UPI00295869BB|nr:uncharacterized protein LOC132707130 [Cylas formicarius]